MSVLTAPQPVNTREKLATFAQQALADYNAAVLREATTGDGDPGDLQLTCVRARMSEEQFLADVATTKRRIKAKADYDEAQRRRAEFEAGEGATLRADIERAKQEGIAAELRMTACQRLVYELQCEWTRKNAEITQQMVDANNILRQRRTVRTEEALREITKSIAPLESFIAGDHRYGTSLATEALVQQLKTEVMQRPTDEVTKRDLARAEQALVEIEALPGKVAAARVTLAELKRERDAIQAKQGDPLEVEFGPGIPATGSALPPAVVMHEEEMKIDRDLFLIRDNAH